MRKLLLSGMAIALCLAATPAASRAESASPAVASGGAKSAAVVEPLSGSIADWQRQDPAAFETYVASSIESAKQNQVAQYGPLGTLRGEQTKRSCDPPITRAFFQECTPHAPREELPHAEREEYTVGDVRS